MADYPKSVFIQEVGPRDGLQIEPRVLSTDDKLTLIRSMVDAGVRNIEVGSFVNPKAVPQMAGTDEVVRMLPQHEDVTYRAVWLNIKGLERALATGRIKMDGKLTMTASETFMKRNTNRTIEETLAEMPAWITRYKEAGIVPDDVGVMAAFGCNFEGDIPPEKVIGLISRVVDVMAEHDCRLTHLRLADTMGWANPVHVTRLINMVREQWPDVEIRLHLHDTRGTAIANALAAMELGVREFDGAIGGLGGCPFAGNVGAAGNVCTEDLVFMCEEMGIDTGINLDALVETAKLAEEFVGHPLPSKLAKAGSLSRFRKH